MPVYVCLCACLCVRGKEHIWMPDCVSVATPCVTLCAGSNNANGKGNKAGGRGEGSEREQGVKAAARGKGRKCRQKQRVKAAHRSKDCS